MTEPEDAIDRPRAARHLATAALKLLARRDPAFNLRKALSLLQAGRTAVVAGPAGDTEVDAQRLAVVRALPPGTGPVCLLVSFSPDGRFWPHLLNYAGSLRAAGCRVVLIATTDRADLRCLDPGPQVADAVVVRANHGYDFAAWASVLRLWPGLWESEALWFANDSVYHSPALFPAFAARVAGSAAPAVAATGCDLFAPHVQSYFFVLKRAALERAGTRAFFAGIRALADKDAVIRAYEVPLQAALEAGGARVEVLAQVPGAGNATLTHWRALLAGGLPLVKVQLLRDNPYKIDLSGWRATLQAGGFDLAALNLHLGAQPLPAAALLVA
ncbi:hypothetical protein V5F53_07805 [Xanthobacter sp. V4C-4]|uniref:hypothetical protein n=1 Tax=Xanthobacter cornucopiae TaxID=3119924 RepID=UPI00372853FD